MKFLLFISFYFFPFACFAQSHCRYKSHVKFETYDAVISTEHAGLFLNGINVPGNQFQVEVNSYLPTLFTQYNDPILAGFLQLRYGVISSIEIQAGGLFQNPYEINSDSLYSRQAYLGIKQNIFVLNKRNHSWHIAYSLKYVRQWSHVEDLAARSGILLSLNNSWKPGKVFHIDVSGGSLYLPSENQFQPLLSGKIHIKEEFSKVGFLVGICGDHFTESFVTLGFIFTNNENRIFHVSAGFLDKAVVPNISYTYLFRK